MSPSQQTLLIYRTSMMKSQSICNKSSHLLQEKKSILTASDKTHKNKVRAIGNLGFFKWRILPGILVEPFDISLTVLISSFLISWRSGLIFRRNFKVLQLADTWEKFYFSTIILTKSQS